nr:hypothetical protein Iba_chr13fCG4810 [Ipomoea batatas]
MSRNSEQSSNAIQLVDFPCGLKTFEICAQILLWNLRRNSSFRSMLLRITVDDENENLAQGSSIQGLYLGGDGARGWEANVDLAVSSLHSSHTAHFWGRRIWIQLRPLFALLYYFNISDNGKPTQHRKEEAAIALLVELLRIIIIAFVFLTHFDLLIDRYQDSKTWLYLGAEVY